MDVVCVNKPRGWTPLMAVDAFRQKFPEFEKEKISYAGRLDPMAEGLLVLLVGQENKRRHEYENLAKEYEVEVVFGISTDSYDALGIPEVNAVGAPPLEGVDKVLRSFTGKRSQAYPPYSSKTVDGKPLFWWARSQRISEIEIPTREVEIYAIRQLSSRNMLTGELCKTIVGFVEPVNGEFRQREIIDAWKKIGYSHPRKVLRSMTVLVESSSGTYMRSLANELGLALSAGAFALGIKRTKVGKYSLSDCVSL